jgi:hypothetical protein
MERVMTLTAALLLAGVARGADTSPAAETFRNVPHWRRGDTFHFDVSKVQSQRNGSATQVGRLKYVAEYRVMEAGPDGYLMEWYMTDCQMTEPPDPSGQAARLASTFGKDSPVRFRLDPDGIPLGRVENWEQVRTATLKSFDMAQESLSETARKRAHDSIAKTLDDPSVKPIMEMAALEEPVLPFLLQGVDFTTPPKKATVKAPVPGTVEQMPAFVTRELVRQDASEVSVRQRIEAGPDAQKALEAMVQSVGGIPFDIPKDAEVTSLSVIDATIDRKSGAIKGLKSMTLAIAADVKKEALIELREKRDAIAPAPTSTQSP